MTQQNAAMVEQSTAASHSLAHEASELNRLVARFQTGAEIAQASSAAPPPRRGQPAPRRQAAMAMKPTQQSAPRA
ncbi:methyl-accepting chemotaxis protein, partial [Streptomyces scabiei]